MFQSTTSCCIPPFIRQFRRHPYSRNIPNLSLDGPDVPPERRQWTREHFAGWNCRGGENNVIVRTDGTVAPCFPMYSATYDWGTIEGHKFDRANLREMKSTCQQHCFSTLNHNLAYCYNDARVMKWLWRQASKGLKGGARSFED